MTLHDMVGINCKKGATAEYKGAGQVYGLRGVCSSLCVLSDLT